MLQLPCLYRLAVLEHTKRFNRGGGIIPEVVGLRGYEDGYEAGHAGERGKCARGALMRCSSRFEHNELFSAGGGIIPEVVGLPRG